MGSGFSRKFCTSFHDWGQVFMFEGKIYPLGRAFTSNQSMIYTSNFLGVPILSGQSVYIACVFQVVGEE
jgi:hypothetical protein